MAAAIRFKYESIKKTPLTDECRNIDTLKGLVRKLAILGADTFELFVHRPGTAPFPLRIQKDLDDAIAKCSDRCLEIEIRVQKPGQSADAQPAPTEPVETLPPPRDLTDTSFILVIPGPTPPDPSDNKFIEILSDETLFELNQKNKDQFGKKNGPMGGDFEMDEEELQYRNRIREEIPYVEEPVEPTPPPTQPTPPASQTPQTPQPPARTSSVVDNKEKERLLKENLAVRQALERALEDNRLLADQLKTAEREKKQIQEKAPTAPAQVTGPMHAGVTCAGCKQKPLLGKRLVCLECPDLNLCSGCEAKGVHDFHMVVRIKEPVLRIEDRLREVIEKGKASCLNFLRQAPQSQPQTKTSDRDEKMACLRTTLAIRDPKIIDDLLREFGHLPLDTFIVQCMDKMGV